MSNIRRPDRPGNAFLLDVDPHYCNQPICDRRYLLEVKANDKKLGLWSDPKPVPPWEFRNKKRRWDFRIKRSGADDSAGLLWQKHP